MILDSAHIIDSLTQANLKLHLIDSIKNIPISGKSNFEIYAPYITAFITLIVLVSTIVANRKQMKKDNLIKIRKEWIQDFIKLSSEIYRFIYLDLRIYNESSDEKKKRIQKVNFYINELRLRTTVDGQDLQEMITALQRYIFCFNEYDESVTGLMKAELLVMDNIEMYRVEKNRWAIDLSNSVDEFEDVIVNFRNRESDKLLE